MAVIYVNGTASTTNSALSGGVTGITGRGSTWRVTFSGAFAAGDSYTLSVVTAGLTFTLGTGDLTGAVPSFCMTLNSRVHFLWGSKWYFSDNNDPTGWEEQAPGAGNIDLSNQFSQAETLVSMAPYQGRVVLASSRTLQIWSIDADPALFALQQTIPNLGCIAALGMQGLGSLDVIFPYTTGIRSLRARESSLNATPVDIGSAVDKIVQAQWATLTDVGIAKSCSVVEPNQNRFWLYVPNADANTTGGKIYVLSYFPANEMIAWSVYNSTYSVTNVQTAFSISKFVVYAGTVYTASPSGLFKMATTYDNVAATIVLPFYDEKRPANIKKANHIDVDVEGSWQVQCSADWMNETWTTALAATEATNGNGKVGYVESGTNFSFKLVSQNTSTSPSAIPAVHSLTLYYELADSP